MVSTTVGGRHVHVGDWIEVRGIQGQPSRRGQIIALLGGGGGGHERYRVRWDERHDSIVYPADGVMIIPADEHRRQEARHARTAANGGSQLKPSKSRG